MSLKTPIYDLSQFPEVYNPSEDTFLFLDALEIEIPWLLKLAPKVVVEIGSGSGVVITALSQIFGNSSIYFATDINPQACTATQETAARNNTSVECLNMDLLSCFTERNFDLILFNPPYVLTDQKEIIGHGLNRAWAGGNKGRNITDQILQTIPNLLSEKGVCYMVILRENDPNEITQFMQQLNFSSTIILERKIPGEYLYIYKFFSNKNL